MAKVTYAPATYTIFGLTPDQLELLEELLSRLIFGTTAALSQRLRDAAPSLQELLTAALNDTPDPAQED